MDDFDFFHVSCIFLVNIHGLFVPLKDKNSVAITNGFQRLLDEFGHKSNKIWVHKGSEFYNKSMKLWLRDIYRNIFNL